MASMTKLRRRLLRWERYAARCGMPSPVEASWAPPLVGHWRAWWALREQRDRRDGRWTR